MDEKTNIAFRDSNKHTYRRFLEFLGNPQYANMTARQKQAIQYFAREDVQMEGLRKRRNCRDCLIRAVAYNDFYNRNPDVEMKDLTSCYRCGERKRFIPWDNDGQLYEYLQEQQPKAQNESRWVKCRIFIAQLFCCRCCC